MLCSTFAFWDLALNQRVELLKINNQHPIYKMSVD